MHCPFCGETEKLRVVPDTSNGEVHGQPARFYTYIFFVVCGECSTEGPNAESSVKHIAQSQAASEWNNRLPHDEDLALRTAFVLDSGTE